MVLKAGHALRLTAQALKEEFLRAGALMHLLLHYAQALITEIAQTAACNQHHGLDQRLCRWLLLNLDRMQGNDVGMTQELIASMLGVRREGVTAAVQQLQKLELIHCTRGHIAIVDRRGLEQRVCECYAVVRKEYERLLPERTQPGESQGTSLPPTMQPSTARVRAIEPREGRAASPAFAG